MKMVVTKVNMKEHNQSVEDIKYWLTKSPQERIAAVTFLINQNLKPGQKMDRTFFTQKKLKP